MSALRAARRRQDDGGMTLIELLVAMAIFTVVLSVFFGGLIIMARSTGRATAVVESGDAARLAFQTMDKQIRYASSVNRPGFGASGSYYFEFITTEQPDGLSPLCTQWRYDPTARTLSYRTWRDVPSGSPTGWRVVADDVRNDLAASPPDLPFRFEPAGGVYTRQRITVRIDVGPGAAGATAQTGADIGTVFVARNSSTLSPSNADADGDGVSDALVCSSHLGRP